MLSIDVLENSNTLSGKQNFVRTGGKQRKRLSVGLRVLYRAENILKPRNNFLAGRRLADDMPMSQNWKKRPMSGYKRTKFKT